MKFTARIFILGLSQLLIGIFSISLLTSFIPDYTAPAFSDRFVEYLRMIFTLDFGVSLRGFPVFEEILHASYITIFLLGITIVTICAISLPLGLFTLNSNNKYVINTINTVIGIKSALPVLVWSALFLMIYFVVFETIPVYEVYQNATGFEKLLMAFPIIFSLVFGDGLFNDVYQTVKSNGDEIVKKPYMKGIRARGGNYLYHQTRGLIEPMVTVISSKITYLISGVIVVENIFNWQGLGYLVWISIQREGSKDYGIILCTSLIIIFLAILFSGFSEWTKHKLHPEFKK